MESKTTLVRAESGVELDSIATVDLDLCYRLEIETLVCNANM